MGQLSIYEYRSCKGLDWMLIGWMNRMEADGELSKTIACGGVPSDFLTFFQSRRLFFTVDDLGNLTRACWIEMCLGSVFIGYYIHPSVRSDQKNKVFFLYDMLEAIFNAPEHKVPVVVGWIQERPTTEETTKFIRLHLRLGYTYCGKVPNFFDGEDCHIVAITREQWEALENGWKTAWVEDRGEVNGWGQGRVDKTDYT